jgi:hypothetical protein
MAAVPVYSITRAEIDEFWSRKEVEAEERRLAAEKEAARIRAKTLKVSPCSWPTVSLRYLSVQPKPNRGFRKKTSDGTETNGIPYHEGMIMFFNSYYGRVTWWIEFFFLKQMEDYVLYEQMVREILMEGNGGDGSAIAAAATGGTTEAQIVGIKHW